jgi:hypothetical protein
MICMNPECHNNIFLTTYKCLTDRPIINLAKTCWNCHKADFLVDE